MSLSIRQVAVLGSVLALACSHASSGGSSSTNGRPAVWIAAACGSLTFDVDRDGLDDGCELAIAQAFAPVLRIDRRDCLWDAAAGRLSGGYLFAAQPRPDGASRVRVAYLPAYFRDCGWAGVACWLRAGACGAHAGDSELIVVDVEPNDFGQWRAVGVFLSAHCFGRSAGDCRWYRGTERGEFDWPDDDVTGSPVVWVARGKHAHYASRRACDRGHWSYDSCDEADALVRFPVRSIAQNVGSRSHPAHGPGGCLTAERLPLGHAGAGVGAVECVWLAERPFRGWQADARGEAPSAYARYLVDIAGF